MTVGEVLTALGFGVAFGAIPALLGAGIVYTGWKRVGHGLTLIRSRPTDVANVENTEGRVEIEGEVVAADEILETPVDETRCVAYDYEVESYEYDQSQDDRRWETVESGEAVAPFLLDDGTGRLLVDPEEYDLWVSRGPPRQTDDSSIQLAELFDSLAHTAEGTRRRYVEDHPTR